jgi:YidC/Oxa1 family membrane protein insertase
MLMTPLTIQQQKFSRLSSKMNPELQAIQKKYKGKSSDQASMAKMNEETQAVYAKYGVNPMGSCLQMAIQLPVLFALYRVIWNIPAYVDKVKDALMPLAEDLIKVAGSQDFLGEAATKLSVSFKEMTELTIVDVLYKFKPANWAALAEKFPDLSDIIADTQKKMDHMNYFLGLNIADSPMNIIRTAFTNKAFLLMIGALMIPVLAALTQWLNAKLMTGNNDNASGGTDNMAQTMKTMNTVMPLMSAFFCLTFPVGLGIYWIAGAVVRSVQQVVINKKIDKIDLDELMQKNLEKQNKKRAKQGLPPQKMTNNANITTRNIDVPVNKSYKPSAKAQLNKDAASVDSSQTQTQGKGKPKSGSLASKAMMVKDYNETHGKK